MFEIRDYTFDIVLGNITGTVDAIDFRLGVNPIESRYDFRDGVAPPAQFLDELVELLDKVPWLKVDGKLQTFKMPPAAAGQIWSAAYEHYRKFEDYLSEQLTSEPWQATVAVRCHNNETAFDLFDAQRMCDGTDVSQLVDVCDRLGLPDCTLPQSYQVMRIIGVEYKQFAKQNRENARLARFYGFDVSGLPTERREALAVNVWAIEAEETIKAGTFNPTDYNGVEQLYMDAFDDPAIARKARRVALERYVKQETNKAAG